MLPTHCPRSFLLMFVCLLLLSSAAFAQDQCSELQALKRQVYGFRPSTLRRQQQEERSKEIDRFWTIAQAQRQRAIACLRSMLQTEGTDRFFLFDGASLLLALNSSPESLQVASDAISRTDLGEIDPAGYVKVVLELARRGADTGALAEKYMKYPKVDSVVPEHALPLDRATGTIFLYGSMSAERADKYVAPLLGSSDKDVHAAAALMLALNMTQESYRALADLPSIDDLPEAVRKQVVAALAYRPPDDKTVPTYSREQVLARFRGLPRTPEQVENELKKDKPVLGIASDEPFIRSAISTLTAKDLDVVREARRSSLMSVSDESLYEYAAYTKVILGVVNRLDLYREYRVH